MEILIRLGTFVSIFSCMALWEYRTPRRRLSRPRRERWVTNLSLTTFNSILVWVTVGSIAYVSALFAAEHGIGLLHWVSLPPWVAVVVTLLGLDFAIYLQHVGFHAVPSLWRLHRVHHADLDIDATTGLRFHPIEIFLSLGFKVAVVMLLGAVPWVVVAFEILLNASSVFNHSNVLLAERIDRWLRWVMVTPDMHRVHHSTRAEETNSNFGFSFSWWDRVCGTYHDQPALGHIQMTIGLSEYRSPFHLGQLLLLPFHGGARPSFFQPQRQPEMVSPQELQILLGQEKSPLVLDVRNADEFSGERGHIPGAVLAPLPEIATRNDQLAAHRTHAIVTV
jgi:sterol desaturase/sphingolipid hydroxylase (fatty acid hydroxylase superfamily)